MRVFIFFHRERSNLIREEKRGAKCERIRVLESSENIFVSFLVTLVGKKIDSRDLKILFRVTIHIYVTNAKKYFNIVVLILSTLRCYVQLRLFTWILYPRLLTSLLGD